MCCCCRCRCGYVVCRLALIPRAPHTPTTSGVSAGPGVHPPRRGGSIGYMCNPVDICFGTWGVAGEAGVGFQCIGIFRWRAMVGIPHFSLVNDHIEICTVMLEFAQRKVVIVAIYRPPSGSVESFSDFIVGVLNDASIRNLEIAVTGDVNIDRIMYENSCRFNREFIYSMFSRKFLTLVNRPTRFPVGDQLGSPSLLDHVWYNRCNVYTSGILLYDMSDHLPVFLIIKGTVTHSNPDMLKIKFRDRSAANYEKFLLACRELDFYFSSTDLDTNVNEFTAKINKLYCKCFPIKIKCVSSKRARKPWISDGIINSIRKKSDYYKGFKPKLISEVFYKQYKNIFTNVIRNAKRSFFTDKFNIYRNNMKATWNLLNKLIIRIKKGKTISGITIDQADISDPNGIAQHFNEYFSRIPDFIDSKIPPAVSDPLDNNNVNIPHSIFFYPVLPSEVVNIVKLQKNSTYGLNCIPTKIFKSVIDYLAEPLALLINDSIGKGIFPDSLKVAYVTPVHKSGSVMM